MFFTGKHCPARGRKAYFHRGKTMTEKMLEEHWINAHKYSCFVYYMGKCIPNVDEQKVKYNQFVKNGLKYCYICGKIEMLS